MQHLDNHAHAFIDETNKVINVSIFQESDHDSQLLEDIRVSLGAKQVVCCCAFGLANIDDTWTGTEFRIRSPFPSWNWDETTNSWKAPISEPVDGAAYRWDESTKTWIEIVAAQ
jgi:hypothetical protein